MSSGAHSPVASQYHVTIGEVNDRGTIYVITTPRRAEILENLTVLFAPLDEAGLQALSAIGVPDHILVICKVQDLQAFTDALRPMLA